MTDFNDVACKYSDGKERIKKRILEAVHISELKMPAKANRSIKGSLESCDSELKFNLMHAKNIKIKPPEYLWDKRLLIGAINLLAGQGGTGKSTISIDFAARVSKGLPWPDGSPCNKGVVAVLSAEDSPETTVIPRFIAHGGDATNLYLMKSIEDKKNGERTVNLQRDVSAFVNLCNEVNPLLIIIDPVSSYLGKTDSHRNSDVRGALEPLSRFAIDKKVCLLLITHFKKKISIDIKIDPVEKVTGSSAFTELSRMVWITSYEVSKDEFGNEIKRYMFLNAKSNLCKQSPGFYYNIDSYLANDLVDVSRIKWSVKIEGTAASKFGYDTENENPRPKKASLHETEKWLAAILSDGPIESSEIYAEAKLCGFSERSLHRCKPIVGVEVFRQCCNDPKSPWMWALKKK